MNYKHRRFGSLRGCAGQWSANTPIVLLCPRDDRSPDGNIATNRLLIFPTFLRHIVVVGYSKLLNA
jgi:hypothetical protein